MKFKLELQYADSHPDQTEDVGQADLLQALKIIHSYPWVREFDKIGQRTKENLTSTVPNVSIKNKDNELLIVSARDPEFFIIEFMNSTHRGELMIPNNTFDNKQGITMEGVVSNFYNGTAKKIIKLVPLGPANINNVTIHKLKDYPLFISGLAIGILSLILILDLWSNGLTSEALPAIYFVVVVIISMGLSGLVTLQYIFTDWNKEVFIDQDGMLVIKLKGKVIKIEKGNIDQFVIVENDNHRTLRYYKYARIKTRDGKTFVVTSFIIDPIELVNKLKINHKDETVFLPRINFDIQTEKQKNKIKRDKEKKKTEFSETFKDYEDSKLRQIIGDKKTYADYARAAAIEILERRRNITVPTKENQ